MAIIAVMTNAGENLRAQNLAGSLTSQITRIEADAGYVATIAAAEALTDVVTPFTPVREATNPDGKALANDPVFQCRYLDPSSDATLGNYDIKGFGVFAGDVMAFYICDSAGAVLREKRPTAILEQNIYITVSSGDLSTFTFQDALPAPLATELVPGLVRLATDAEVKADAPPADKAVTTSNLDAIKELIADASAHTGDVKATIRTTAESGWLMCDGASHLKTAYPALAPLCTEDPQNSLRFLAPDYRGMVLAGAHALSTGPLGALNAVGETGGAATHTLTIDQMPAHSHEVPVSNPIAGTPRRLYATNLIQDLSQNPFTNSAGGGESHPIVQPTAIVNWMVKT